MSTKPTKTIEDFQPLLAQLVELFSRGVEEVGDNQVANVEEQVVADQASKLAPIFAEIRQSIAASLPTDDFSSMATHNDLAMAINQSNRYLSARQSEIRRFLESLCYHAVQIKVKGIHNVEAKAKALESARKPLLAAVSAIATPLEPLLTAELIAQPVAIIQAAANAWVQEACNTVAAQLLLSLNALVELDVVGLIEWPGETACKLHFFRHVVVQDRVHIESTERIAEGKLSEGGRLRVERWEKTKGRNTYSIERHEHHVMNAEPLSLRESTSLIPREYNELVQRIPDWLQAHIRILKGDLILEKVITRKGREESWETKPTLKSSVELRSAYEIDPAITIGHFVVAGWGEREIVHEANRRMHFEKSKRAPQPEVDLARNNAVKEYGLFAPLAKAGVIVSSLLMLFSRLQPSVMIALALLLTTATIVVTWKSFHSYSRWTTGNLDILFVALGTSAVAFGLLGVESFLYGILFGCLPLIGLSIVTGIASKFVWDCAKSR
jgi:hypothetical protein